MLSDEINSKQSAKGKIFLRLLRHIKNWMNLPGEIKINPGRISSTPRAHKAHFLPIPYFCLSV